MESPIMTDKEVAKFFHISVKTLQRRLKKPKAGEIDLNKATPDILGGKRFWLRSAVYETAGITRR
jgi:hypothetical protein